LKSEGFIADQDLSKRIHATLFRVHEDLLTSGVISEFDDTFSITVRELRQLARVAGCASNKYQKEEELNERIERETKVVAEVTRLFILEKIYSNDLGKSEEVQSEVLNIVKSEFQLETLPSLTEKKPNKGL